MDKLTILTTSPSIDIKNNVSGIANMTRLWIVNNNKVNYILFTAGKKDKTNHNMSWLFSQISILWKFFRKIRENKNIDIIHVNMPLERLAILRDFCFVFISSLFGKPIIVHLRGGNYNLRENTPKYLRFLIKSSFKRAKKIIVLGEKELAFYLREYGLEVSKICVLSNSVEISETLTKKKRTNCLNILYLGRLDKNKGLKEIILSLSSLKINFKLQIAGDGNDKDWFLEQCEHFLKDKYLYLKVVHGDNKTNLLKNSDIFILPSYFEGLPNALLESMSFGIVPIVTPVGSIPNIVIHENNGIIVPVKNTINISDNIIRIYEDEKYYNRLSMNAFKTIKNNYSLKNYLATLNVIYHDLLIN